MNSSDQYNLLEKVKHVIADRDPGEAEKILKELKDGGSYLNLPRQAILGLKFIAFPTLSDEECIEIIKNSYLESFTLDFSMKDKITAKLFFYPYGARDEVRKKFKKALLENRQRIGSLTIEQWLQEFEKSSEKNKNPLSASVNFISKNQKALILTPIEKRNLKDLLYVYAYLLSVTIPTTEPNLSKIMQISSGGLQTQNIFQNSPQTKTGGARQRTATKTIPLSEALEKHLEIGEQLITSNRLKLKNYPEPARPSIKNWLSDYTFNLGFSSHSAMDRGTYLFKNENAKILNSSDRERLSFILKAYDEKSPVDINTNTNQVVFPQKRTPQLTASQNVSNMGSQPRETYQKSQPKPTNKPNRFQEIYNRQNQTNEPQDIFEKTRQFTGSDNYSPKKVSPQAKNLNFSSPQKFSHEKQNLDNRKNINQPSPSTNNTPPGNIVNLKDRQ